MTNDDGPSEGLSELGDMKEALARARKATEELPPLEELGALQEAMSGLAEVGALLGGMRLVCERGKESREKPAEGPDFVDLEGA